MDVRKYIAEHRDVIQIVASVIIALATGFDMIGQPARMVHLLTLSVASIGAGAGIGVFVERRRHNRRDQSSGAEQSASKEK
jgi:hypothetical protein